MKAQSGLEYVMVYIASAAIVVYVLATNLLVGVLGMHAQSALAQSGTSCYISSELQCIAASANSTTGNFVIVLTNNAGLALKIPPQSFGARIKPFIKDFIGSCTPTMAAENSSITCTVDMGSSNLTKGEELTPNFTIGYEECQYGICGQQIIATGTATLYSS